MNTYTKICTKCKISKPISEFKKDKTKKDGFYPSCKVCVKKRNDDNKESIKKYNKKYHDGHKEERKKWREDNYEKYLETRAKWGDKNPDYFRNYYQINKDYINKRNTDYQLRRRKIDPLYKLIGNIRSLIKNSITESGFTKSTKTAQILGCSYEEFKIHIENQFMAGMSWDNRSEWHLDHITPMSWGKTEKEIIALNHYTNFQPLWAIDNMKKGNRFSG